MYKLVATDQENKAKPSKNGQKTYNRKKTKYNLKRDLSLQQKL